MGPARGRVANMCAPPPPPARPTPTAAGPGDHPTGGMAMGDGAGGERPMLGGSLDLVT